MKIICFLLSGVLLISCRTVVRGTGLAMCKANCDIKNPNAMTMENRDQARKSDVYDKSAIEDCIKKCENKYKK